MTPIYWMRIANILDDNPIRLKYMMIIHDNPQHFILDCWTTPYNPQPVPLVHLSRNKQVSSTGAVVVVWASPFLSPFPCLCPRKLWFKSSMLGFGTVLRINDQKHRRTETLIFPIYNENPKTSIIASSQFKIVKKDYISSSESCWEGTVQETMFSVAFCYGTYI
jgi:hypothetical protein